MLPKPVGGAIPLLITGGSRQTPEWVAEHGDGWMTYPRSPMSQCRVVAEYREKIAAAGVRNKPVVQSLYIDLVEDADAPAEPIHLGFRSGISALQDYLRTLQVNGVNHVALNLRFNRADDENTLRRLADELLPEFTNERETCQKQS